MKDLLLGTAKRGPAHQLELIPLSIPCRDPHGRDAGLPLLPLICGFRKGCSFLLDVPGARSRAHAGSKISRGKPPLIVFRRSVPGNVSDSLLTARGKVMKEGCGQQKNSGKGGEGALSSPGFWKTPRISAASETPFSGSSQGCWQYPHSLQRGIYFFPWELPSVLRLASRY